MVKVNRTCKNCGETFATPRKLRDHEKRKFKCKPQDLISEIDPEVGPSTKRQRKEALSSQELTDKDKIPKFEKTDLRYAGLEILDAHYRASILEQVSYSKDPISTLNILRPQMERIFYNRFKLTHGFKARICLIARMNRCSDYMNNIFGDPVNDDGTVSTFSLYRDDYKEVPFKNKSIAISSLAEISPTISSFIWDIESRIDKYIHEGSGWYYNTSLEVNIEMPIYEPLSASSHLPLPKGMKTRNNGIINIQNEDNRCFEWCILADLYPAFYHKKCITHY